MPELNYKLRQRKNNGLVVGVYAAPVSAGTIDTNDLVDLIAADSQVERAQVAVITDAVCKQIKELVLNGHSIKVGTLGTLSLSIKAKMFATPEEAASEGAKAIKSAHIRLTGTTEIKDLQRATRVNKAPAKTTF